MSDPTLDAERAKLHERINNDLNLHKPNAEQQAAMDAVRAGYSNLAHGLINALPPGRDLSMALTDLETSQRCAIAAIAKNQEHYQ